MIALESAADPVGIPSAEDVRQASDEAGFAFPPTYVEFCREYGRGEIDSLLYIWVPTMAHPDRISQMWRTAQANLRTDVEHDLAEYAPDGSPELACRLVPFGFSSNGHVLAWDPTDVDGDEYAIWVVGEASLSFTKACYGVWDFLKMVMSAEHAPRVLGPSYEALRPRFRPSPLG